MEPETRIDHGLDWLLHPHTSEEFFTRYWEQQPLRIQRGDLGYYADLMTGSDLERFIAESDLRYPALRLAKGGKFFGPEAYARNLRYGDETFAAVPDLEQVAAEYRRGATVMLPAMHRHWTALRSLCAELENHLDHAAHANVYLTPGNAAGFTPHYDVHEVFVLQISGAKRWTVYEPTTTLPHRSQPCTPNPARSLKVHSTLELEPGDFLYLPRGYLHSTTTSATHSAHITVGIGIYAWADLLKEYLSAWIDSTEWRRALPPGFAHRQELEPTLLEGMRAALEHLRRSVDPQKLLDTFTRRVRESHRGGTTPFRLDANVIDAHSVLQVVEASRYRLTMDGPNAVLEFAGQRHRLPIGVGKTLFAMTERASFRVSDLPGDLEPESKLGLVRYLHEIGFLSATT
jgi:ribosomal protein L16 Arg81 hydroxylase